MQKKELTTYRYGKETEPESLVIFLHGYGSNGQDLISIALDWEEGLPNTLFVSPDAPFQCEMSALGFQWFSLEDRRDEVMLANIEVAAPILEAYIAGCAKTYNVPYNKIALVGFSQGTMMSLYSAPRLSEALAGVMGYSGALLDGKSLSEDPDRFQKFPINLRHGSADEVVPVEAFELAQAQLKAAGYDVEGDVTPGLGHGIDQDSVSEGLSFLQKIL